MAQGVDFLNFVRSIISTLEHSFSVIKQQRIRELFFQNYYLFVLTALQYLATFSSMKSGEI